MANIARKSPGASQTPNTFPALPESAAGGSGYNKEPRTNNQERTTMNYLFGPVASRRLGRSLGVDLVPFKTCSLNCIYCECGRTTVETLERKEYISFGKIIAELKRWLDEGGTADYITLAGSGEPTLNSRLGDIIREVKKMTDIPVCILTNGTLFFREDVRAEAALADLVIPSLDAPDEIIFEKINRPPKQLNFQKYINGLIEFSENYTGKLWLEIFIVPKINDDEKSVAQLAQIAEKIQLEKIQLNTAVRPTAEKNVLAEAEEKMREIAKMFSKPVEVVASFDKSTVINYSATKDKVFNLLSRRPCTIEDIAAGLGIKPADAKLFVSDLLRENAINKSELEGKIFYISKRDEVD